VGLKWKLLGSEDKISLNPVVAQQAHAYARALKAKSPFRIQHARKIYGLDDPVDCAFRDVPLCDLPSPNHPMHCPELAEPKNKIEGRQPEKCLQEQPGGFHWWSPSGAKPNSWQRNVILSVNASMRVVSG
jgi:hypothetical protein